MEGPIEEIMAEPNVTYSIKEIFEEIKAKLIQIEMKLDGKADRKDLEELKARVLKLETEAVTDEAIAKYKKWMIGLLVGIGITIMGAVINMVISIIKWAAGH